ncbi:MAG: porin [Pseudomonadota bacterium]
MRQRITALCLSVAVCAISPVASAQSSSTEMRLQALEAEIASLRAELAAEREQRQSDVILLDQKVQQPVPVDAPSGTVAKAGFQVGDTTFKIGGYVDFDASLTDLSDGTIGSSSIARDFYIPSVTPVGGEGSTVTDFTAQATRLSVAAQRDVGGKAATGYLEMDFLGSFQGNERVSSSFSPRLRRAYLDYMGVRIGQEWTTFQNTSAIPESASFLVLSDGMVFNRQPLVRLTRGNFQFALENPDATVTPASGAGRIEADGNIVPDVVARYNLKGDFGNLSLAALGRQLRLETGVVDEATFGYALSASGRINVGERDDIRFNLVGGEGAGRYVGLNAINGAAMDPQSGDLEAIGSFGGLIAWRHPFGQTARLNIGYSGLWADNPDFLTDLNPSATESVQSTFAAVLWDIAPKVTVGVEGLYGVKELENGDDGSISRLTFSTKYGF